MIISYENDSLIFDINIMIKMISRYHCIILIITQIAIKYQNINSQTNKILSRYFDKLQYCTLVVLKKGPLNKQTIPIFVFFLFALTENYVTSVQLIQVNQAGSSSAMEVLAFRKAFTFLLGTGMIIKSFICDRHTSIAKWMRGNCARRCREIGKPVVQHFFDLCHIAKSMQISLSMSISASLRSN